MSIGDLARLPRSRLGVALDIDDGAEDSSDDVTCVRSAESSSKNSMYLLGDGGHPWSDQSANCRCQTVLLVLLDRCSTCSVEVTWPPPESDLQMSKCYINNEPPP